MRRTKEERDAAFSLILMCGVPGFTRQEVIALRADLEDAEAEIVDLHRGEFRPKPLATGAGGE